MASTVFVHLGLPKTATTYLQTIMWGARDQMRAEGVLLPGRERRDHLWTSRVVREDPNLVGYDDRQRTAWDRLKKEIAAWPGTAVISHEFFGAADTEQAERMVAELAPAEVHLVVTAREPLGLFTASWQESLKNRDTRPLAGYGTVLSDNPLAIWNWRTLDLTLVMGRWGGTVPPERVHVLPLPRGGAPRDTIWHRFGTLIGLDSHAYDLGESFPNTSMGVVEAETLRRVNHRLYEREMFDSSLERGVFIRTFLADERLVPRGGDKYWPTPTQVEECRERGAAAVAWVREHGYDVVGDVEDLLVPDELEERRSPESVTDAEVARVATDLVAVLLGDVRDLRGELRRTTAARERLEEPTAAPAPAWRRAGSRVKQGLRRAVGRPAL
jgi:hypothetical protein